METPKLSKYKKKRNRDQVSPLVDQAIKSFKMTTSEASLDIALGKGAPDWANNLLTAINTKLTSNENRILQELQKVIAIKEEDIIKLKEQNSTLETQVSQLEKACDRLEDRLLQQETYSRRRNLLFRGVSEPAWETYNQCEITVREIISNHLKIDPKDMVFDRLHRLGQKNKYLMRPIIVRFSTMNDRDCVWKARPKYIKTSPKTTDLRIIQDFPPEVVSRRRRLIPILIKAKTLQEYSNAYIHDDKLTINGTTYTVKSLHQLPHILDPRYIATQKKDHMVLYWNINSPLSNHHPCSMTVNNTAYNCVEQCFFHTQAIQAGDHRIAQEIMDTSDPVHQKRAAKAITPNPEWQAMSVDVMKEAVLAKFTQNKHLKDFLIETGELDIVEASEYDKFWGVGLPMTSPLIGNRAKWNGKNTMGQILSDVREQLK